MKCSSISILQCFLTNSLSLNLAANFPSRYCFIKSAFAFLSSLNFLGISFNKSYSANQSFLSPLYLVNNRLNSGKAQCTHLLGVTPLVTLVNLVGQIS